MLRTMMVEVRRATVTQTGRATLVAYGQMNGALARTSTPSVVGRLRTSS
jgi:hypothetical protein